jgi:AcrR family transcriptional regulator
MPHRAKPLRRDAQRNRDQLVQAARQLFAVHGLDVALDEIARTAGVSIGTLYNRFPDRADLVNAVFADRAETVVRIAEHALSIPDPWAGLVHFLERICELQAAGPAPSVRRSRPGGRCRGAGVARSRRRPRSAGPGRGGWRAAFPRPTRRRSGRVGHVRVGREDVVDQRLGQAETREPRRVQGFVDQDVRPGRERDDVRGRRGVAGEDDAAVVGVEAVGVGGEDRAVRDEDGGDLHVVVLHDGERRHGRRGVRRRGADTRRRQYVVDVEHGRRVDARVLGHEEGRRGRVRLTGQLRHLDGARHGVPGAPATVEAIPAEPGP